MNGFSSMSLTSVPFVLSPSKDSEGFFSALLEQRKRTIGRTLRQAQGDRDAKGAIKFDVEIAVGLFVLIKVGNRS